MSPIPSPLSRRNEDKLIREHYRTTGKRETILMHFCCSCWIFPWQGPRNNQDSWLWNEVLITSNDEFFILTRSAVKLFYAKLKLTLN